MVRLDPLAFPYITEVIISYSTWPECLALRLTCKSFLEQVDAVLCQHLVISADESLTLTILPYGLSRSTRTSISAMNDTGRTFCRTRIVDFVGRTDDCFIPKIEAMSNVNVVRVRPDRRGAVCSLLAITAPTMVVFAHKCFPPPIPEGVTKLVICIKYHGKGVGTLFSVSTENDSPYDQLKELVIIMTHWLPDPPYRPSYMIADKDFSIPDIDPDWDDLDSDGNMRRIGFGYALAEALYHNRSLLIKIVDLHKVDPRYLGMHRWSASEESQEGELPSPGHLRRWILHAAASDLDMFDDERRNWTEGERDAEVARIEFLTGSEYEALMGRQRYLLETEEEF